MTPAPCTTVAHKPLGAQAQQVLRYMIEHGGIDKRDAMELGIWNLPGRIYDIRQAFGDAAVASVEQGEARWVVYQWRGEIAEQGVLL